MAGFDDLPRDLRLLLHEHGLHQSHVELLARELRAGRAVNVLVRGTLYKLEP